MPNGRISTKSRRKIASNVFETSSSFAVCLGVDAAVGLPSAWAVVVPIARNALTARPRAKTARPQKEPLQSLPRPEREES